MKTKFSKRFFPWNGQLKNYFQFNTECWKGIYRLKLMRFANVVYLFVSLLEIMVIERKRLYHLNWVYTSNAISKHHSRNIILSNKFHIIQAHHILKNKRKYKKDIIYDHIGNSSCNKNLRSPPTKKKKKVKAYKGKLM